jgi:hypothetical protein
MSYECCGKGFEPRRHEGTKEHDTLCALSEAIEDIVMLTK